MTISCGQRNALRSMTSLICRSAIYLSLLLPTAWAAGPWILEGAPGGDSDDVLCAALLKRLNSLPEACAIDALETYQGFAAPPWKDLDPKEHQELIAKLLKYLQLGPRKYFDTSRPHNAAEDAHYRSKAEIFTADGGQLKVWRTRLVPRFGDYPAPPDVQTVVLLDTHMPTASEPKVCPGKRSRGWTPSLFLVTPDLSGPDPDIDAGNASLLEFRTVLLYHDIPYLVGIDTVFKGFGDAGLHGACSFEKLESRALVPTGDRK